MKVLLRRAQRKIKRMKVTHNRGARIWALMVALAICFCALAAAQAQGPSPIPPLVITDEPLPQFDAGVDFHFVLHATGGLPSYGWSVQSGDLPDGISLSREGFLTGRPSQPGSFQFVIKVDDSGHPAQTRSKEFQVEVTAPLLLEWLDPAKVQDDRIDGSVQVSNGSKENFDLTVVIVAVADNGRATAIGYQHFDLKAGALNVKIPFGSSLPHGGYTIHVDAIAEIPKRNAIIRQRLETPQPLQVIQGP
jgi:hypothetical protein